MRVHVTKEEDGFWEVNLFHSESFLYLSRGRWGAGKRTHVIHDAQSRVWAGELIWELSAEQQSIQPCELMGPSRALISNMVDTRHMLPLNWNLIKLKIQLLSHTTPFHVLNGHTWLVVIILESANHFHDYRKLPWTAVLERKYFAKKMNLVIGIKTVLFYMYLLNSSFITGMGKRRF